MTHSLRTLRPLAALVVVCSLPGSLARWAPAEGERVEWTWRVQQELELVEMAWIIGASDAQPFRWYFENVTLAAKDVLELVVRDRLVARDEDRPLRLERELVRARRTVNATYDLDEDEIETVSRLEGTELVFEWNEEEERMLCGFAEDAEDAREEEPDEELLEALDEPLDLRGLLDDGTRKPGDSWRLDEASVRRLLRPGGDLSLVAPEADFDREQETAALGWLLGAALSVGESNSVGRATYEAKVFNGEHHLARIRLRLQTDVEGDVRELLQELADTLGSWQSWLELAERIRVEHRLVLEGVLYWDLDSGRADNLRLHGGLEVKLEIDLGQGGLGLGDSDSQLVAELRGEVELAVDSEDVGEELRIPSR